MIIAKASSFCLASDLLLVRACAPPIHIGIPAPASGMWDTLAVGISWIETATCQHQTLRVSLPTKPEARFCPAITLATHRQNKYLMVTLTFYFQVSTIFGGPIAISVGTSIYLDVWTVLSVQSNEWPCKALALWWPDYIASILRCFYCNRVPISHDQTWGHSLADVFSLLRGSQSDLLQQQHQKSWLRQSFLY